MHLKTHPSFKHYLGYFLALNLVFLGLQTLLVLSHAGNFVSAMRMPWLVYLEIIWTAFAHLLLYALLSWYQTLLLVRMGKQSPEDFDRWMIIIWVASTVAILCANAYFFPASQFSRLLSDGLTRELFLPLLIVSCSILVLLTLNLLKKPALFIPVLAAATGYYLWPESPVAYTPKPEKNVIIIGIDSLSPTSINSEHMPFVSQWSKQGLQFTQAISPLARTYPAWISILTGLYPIHHQARENLIAPTHVLANHSVAWTFKNKGYHTVFATDDRRFNNLDEAFGFKEIIGPKAGVNDVLIGAFNDFPLSNLVIPFKISAMLFPYNYINRASFYSYYPQSFDRALKNRLSALPDKPLFLAVHFALPHWPYAFATTRPDPNESEFGLTDRSKRYQAALLAVDRQVARFFKELQQRKLLQNTIVILLSDHGETLYTPGSRQTTMNRYEGKKRSPLAEYFKSQTATDLDKSAGHGSDLLSPDQYHSLLNLFSYDNDKQTMANTRIDSRVALIDIAPTLGSLAAIKFPDAFDGTSLLHPKERCFFLESGMFPNQDISKEKALRIGKRYYRINPQTTAMELRQDKLDHINQQKIYGVIQGEWILALYPDKKKYLPVIQNLSSGQWSDAWDDAFTQASPAYGMYSALHEFLCPSATPGFCHALIEQTGPPRFH